MYNIIKLKGKIDNDNIYLKCRKNEKDLLVIEN